MKKRISGVLALILAATLVLSITGCGNKTNSNQSSEQQSNYHNPDIEAKDLLYDLEMIDFQGMVENKDVDPVYTDFAVKLAQASDQKDANLLVSPMSVMYGLMLPANGAKGDTLSQFEKTLGANTYTLNRYLYFTMEGEYPKDSAKFVIGDSLWINNSVGYSGDEEYLKNMHTFFDASIFTADFKNVEKDIGLWLSDKGVSQNTKLIPGESDVMTSINSYMLNAPWNTALSADKTNTKFTASNGSQTDAEFLSGNAERLLKSDKAQGFAKTFKGDHYAMAVIMPNEGVSVEDYLKSLTGKSLTSMLSTAQQKNVSISMPKITQKSDISVKKPLQAMGIKDAFDSDKADFSAMGKSEKDLVLSDVVADTEMMIDANGVNSSVANASKNKVTKADAQITVNRPFIYMIYDLEQNIPKFIGTYKKAGA